MPAPSFQSPTFSLPTLNYRYNPNPDLEIFPAWTHYQVRYWAQKWIEIRDCLLGEQEIKAKGATYLPKMANQEPEEYRAYLDRAVFFNMVTRTINAVVGQMFEKDPEHSNVPAALKSALSKVCYEPISLEAFECNIAEELSAMGRFGVLVDQDAAGAFDPFLRGYTTENILDWQLAEIDGRRQPIQIVLREFVEHPSRVIGQPRTYDIIFRVLSLDIEPSEHTGRMEPIYRQYIYTINTLSGLTTQVDLSSLAPTIVTPTAYGVPFRSIPFQAFGSRLNTLDPDPPPASDLVNLNLAHYRTYAHLEHGRWFTALPIYWVSKGNSNAEAEYSLGPSVVWEIGKDEKAGILEFNGQGLKTLETSLSQKEDQIAMIGARLMGGYSRSTSESDQQAAIKESNERSLSLRIISNIDVGMSNVLNIWGTWKSGQETKIEVKLNTAFLAATPDARAVRAAQMMFEAGIMPITELHGFLQKGGYVSEDCSIDDFKALLDKVEEFPNNPDVWARMKGYGNATNRHAVNLQRRTLRDTEDRTAIMQQQATTDKKEALGNLDIKQQQVDVAQQQADTAEQAQETAAKALAEQQKASAAAQAAGGGDTVQVSDPNRNPVQAKATFGGPGGAGGGAPLSGQKPAGTAQSKPLPSQVNAARETKAFNNPAKTS